MVLDLVKINTYVLDELGQADIDKVIRYANRAIAEINDRILGDHRVEKAVGDGIAESGYTWNERLLTIPEIWNKVSTFIADREIFRKRELGEVQNGFIGYSELGGRQYLFGRNAQEIYVDGFKKLPTISGTGDSFDIDERYFQGIIDGMFVHFYKSKDYKDKEMHSYYYGRFETFLEDIDRRK